MRFIESIFLKDGVYHNLPFHQERINTVFNRFAPGLSAHDLSHILPVLSLAGTYKVRMVYDMDSEDASYDLEFAAYHPRKIDTLEVVPSEPFDYSMKYEDRSVINRLIKKTHADDIIIAIDGMITDGSYSNLAFFDGQHWHTPDTPLLNGVRRQQLLGEGKLLERSIPVKDISLFQKVSLINAMLTLGDLQLPIEAIALPKSDA